MSLNYDNPFIKDNMFKGEFGLEIESLRVDKYGFLSHTKHPFNNNPIEEQLNFAVSAVSQLKTV